jgi:hypothetical protein
VNEPQLSSVPVEQALEPDYVEFARAGARITGEFECTGCGYGAFIARELPPCPMCRGRLWERRAWSPFSDLIRRLPSA